MKSRAKSGSVKQWLGVSALSFSALALLAMSVALAAETASSQAQKQFNFSLAAKPLPQAHKTMSKSDEKAAREQRLAAKLRENLKRRKQQARARAGEGGAGSQKPSGGSDTGKTS